MLKGAFDVIGVVAKVDAIQLRAATDVIHDVGDAATAVGRAVETAWDNVERATVAAWDNVERATVAAWDGTLSFIEGIPGDIERGLSDLGSDVTSVATSAWDDFSGACRNGVEDAIRIVDAVPGDVEHVFADAGSWLLSAGEDILHGLEHGIEDGLGDVLGAVKHVGSSIVSGFKSVLSIFSPSRVTYTHGLQLDKGLAAGLLAGEPELLSAAASVASHVGTTMRLHALASPTIAAQVAAGGTSTPAAITGAGLGAAGGGGTTHVTVNVNVTGTMNMDTPRAVDALGERVAGSVQAALLRNRRSLGGTAHPKVGLGLS